MVTSKTRTCPTLFFLYVAEFNTSITLVTRASLHFETKICQIASFAFPLITIYSNEETVVVVIFHIVNVTKAVAWYISGIYFAVLTYTKA